MKKLRKYASVLTVIISVLVLSACEKTEQKVMYSNFAHKFYLCTLKIQYLAALQLSMFSQLCRLQFRF